MDTDTEMDDHLTNLIIEIKTALASIDAKVSGILDQVKNHENRLLELEKATAKQTGDGWNKDVMKMLTRGLLVALGIIGTMTGASALISKICGN